MGRQAQRRAGATGASSPEGEVIVSSRMGQTGPWERTIVITEDGLSAWPFRTVACLGFDFYLEEIASGDIS